VRMYVRSLAAVATPAGEEEELNVAQPVFQVRAEFTATGALAEQVLQILLEGLRNTLRHGGARSASLEASSDEAAIRIRLDDDGVGFPPRSPAPWSIASRVADLGGSVKIDDSRPGGAHVDIELPGDHS
jgi:signal transduction histidine kinase